MSLKDRLKVKLNPAFYWRVAMWLSCMVFFACLVGLWFSAKKETADAQKSSRRVIMRLSDGTLEQIGAEALPTAPEAEATATPTATAAEVTTATETASAVTATETATAAAPTATPTAEAAATAMLAPPPEDAPEPATTASVPLTPIKNELREKTPTGYLPIIAKDGSKPWTTYAKPYTGSSSQPMIAIVITGLGHSKTASQAAIKLPENIGLSFSPYAKDAGLWSNSARATGHEVFLDLPVEPTNYPASDPGPYGLLAGKSVADNTSRLLWLMGRTLGYCGFITPDNEAYTQNDENFKATVTALNKRGLMLLMPHESTRAETRKLLEESKIPFLPADVVLDEDLSTDAIEARLTALQKIATKQGYAIGYAHGIPITIAQLTAWMEKLEKRGYILVPVTAIAAKKFK